ncbi:MAG: hypothetical protein PHN72_05125 [Bacilli bacterium]|nr:hypothetical protein [Bacilli bacterium]
MEKEELLKKWDVLTAQIKDKKEELRIFTQGYEEGSLKDLTYEEIQEVLNQTSSQIENLETEAKKVMDEYDTLRENEVDDD